MQKCFLATCGCFRKVGVKNGRLWAGHVCAHPPVQGLPGQGPQLYPWQVGLSQGWRFGESKEIVSFCSVEIFQFGFILALLIVAAPTPIYVIFCLILAPSLVVVTFKTINFGWLPGSS